MNPHKYSPSTFLGCTIAFHTYLSANGKQKKQFKYPLLALNIEGGVQK